MAEDILVKIGGDAAELRQELSSSEKALGDLRSTALSTNNTPLFDKAEESLKDIDAELKKVEDAAKDSAASLESIGDAAERLERAKRSIADLGTLLEKIKDQGLSAATGLEGVSDRTRAGAEAGVQSSQELKAATEAFLGALAKTEQGADAANAALEKLGSAPAEFLADASTESERLALRFADLAQRTQNLAKAGEAGLGPFTNQAARARVSLAELKAEVDSLGDRASPQLRAELARLEARLNSTFTEGESRARAVAVEVRKVQDSAGLAGEQFRTLGDAVLDLGGPKALAAFTKVQAGLAGLQESYRLTRQAIEALKEAGIVDVDSGVQDFLENQRKQYEVGLAVLENYTAGTGDLANALIALKNAGAPIPDDFREILKAAESLARQQEIQAAATRDQVIALDELKEKSLGLDFKTLESEIKRTTTALLEISEAEENLSDGQILAIGKAVQELLAKAKLAGENIDQELVESLRRMASAAGVGKDKIDELTAAAERNKKRLEEAAKKAKEADFGKKEVEAAAEALLALDARITGLDSGGIRDLGNVTKEAADAMLAAIEELLKKIALLDPETRKSLEGIKKQAEGLKEEYKSLGSEYEKSQVEALKKVEEAAEASAKKRLEIEKGLAESLKAVAQSLAEALSPEQDTGDGGAATLDEKKRRIAELQSLNILTIEQSEELNHLQDEASELLGKLAKEAGQTTTEWEQGLGKVSDGQREVRKILFDLVTGNEQFRAGFKSLDVGAQAALQGIISSLDQSAQEGTLTADQLRAAGQSIEETFQGAGIKIGDLSEIIGGISSDAGGLTNAFAGLAAEGGESLDDLGESAEDAGRKHEIMAEGVRDLKDALLELEGKPMKILVDTEKLLAAMEARLKANVSLCTQLVECLRAAGEA